MVQMCLGLAHPKYVPPGSRFRRRYRCKSLVRSLENWFAAGQQLTNTKIMLRVNAAACQGRWILRTVIDPIQKSICQHSRLPTTLFLVVMSIADKSFFDVPQPSYDESFIQMKEICQR